MKKDPDDDSHPILPPGSPPVPQSQSVDLDKLLDEKLTQRQRQQERQDKISYVREELKKLHGDNYQQEVLKKAQELGVTAEFLQTVAEQSPKAFLELVKPSRVSPPPGLTSSSVRLPSTGTARNLAWYRKQMQQDKKLRTNETFQIQMQRDAQAQGEAFFN